MNLTNIVIGRLASVLALLLGRSADEVDSDVCGWQLEYTPMETET